MKIIQRKRCIKIFGKINKVKISFMVVLSIVFQLLFPIYPNIAWAASSNVIDEIIITNESNPGADTFKSYYDWVKIDVKLSIKPDSNIQAGDKIIMKLPSELTGYIGTIPLNDDKGNNFGNVEGEGDTVVITFSDTVKTLQDINGGFFIQSKIKSMSQEGVKIVPLIFEVDGTYKIEKKIKIDTGTISSGSGGDSNIDNSKKEVEIEKNGETDAADQNLIGWRLDINRYHAKLDNIVVTDQIANGHELVNGSCIVYKYPYTNKITGTTENGGYVTLDKNNFEFSANGFIVKLGSTEGSTYSIIYKTRIIDKSATEFKNKATLSVDSKEIKSIDVPAKIFTSGGYASGKIDTVKGSFKLIKKDEVTNELLQGAKFQLINDKNTTVAELTTDEHGEVIANEIPSGKYTLKEIEAPKGYILDATSQNIELDYKVNKTIEKIVMNKKSTPIVSVSKDPIKGNLKIIKKDEKTNALLQGAKFQLINDKNIVEAEVTTDEHGEAIVKEIPSGKYTLKEIEAPKGYIVDATSQNIELDFKVNKAIEKAVTNKKSPMPMFTIEPIKGSIKIKKIDKDDVNKVLEGAKFKIKGASENNKNIELTGTTDKNGLLIFNDVLNGKYILTEIEAPKVYIKDSIEKEITIKSHKEEILLEVTNKKESPSRESSGGGGTTPKNPDKNDNKPENKPIEEKPRETINIPDGDIPQGKIEVPQKKQNEETIHIPNENTPQGKIEVPQKNIIQKEVLKVLPKTGESSNAGVYLLGIFSVILGIFIRKRAV